MATSEGIPSSIDIEFLELNDNPYIGFATETSENVWWYDGSKVMKSIL